MDWIATKNPDFKIRFATPDDAPLVVEYMRRLGTFQKMRDKITATEENMRRIMSEARARRFLANTRVKLKPLLITAITPRPLSAKRVCILTVFMSMSKFAGRVWDIFC